MNITLRKANALQNSIKDAIRTIKIVHTVELNEFQDVEVALQKANTELFVNDSRRQKLLVALYTIRGAVGTANATSGINEHLAKAAFIDKRISQLEEISSVTEMTDVAVIVGKLDKIKNDKGENSRRSLYGYNDTVSTSVVTQEQIAQARAEIQTLRKQKQKINDSVLELNIRTEISLETDLVEVLAAEGLI